MGLRFNIEGLSNELLKNLKSELEGACIAWEIETMSKVRHNYFGKDENPYVGHAIKMQVDGIIAYLEANTYVLADSYGTGSFMLENNPGLKDYMNSKYWNKERKGKAIAGRKEGEYVDLFGRRHSTSGAFKGVNIEGKRVYTRKKDDERDYYISPTHPSYAIQLAENWLYKTYLPNAYKLAVKKTNFAKYLIES